MTEMLGNPPVPGTLNVVLNRPLGLIKKSGIAIGGTLPCHAWHATINGCPALLIRWPTCPISIVEVVSERHLRAALDLNDGDVVNIRVSAHDVEPVGTRAYFGWLILWKGRGAKYYDDQYERLTVSLQNYLHTCLVPPDCISRRVWRLRVARDAMMELADLLGASR